MVNPKAVLLIADGLGDRPIKELGDRTPLEATEKPELDLLASQSECGLMDPIAPGVGQAATHRIWLSSDTIRINITPAEVRSRPQASAWT